jgi:DNA-binding winged helix-turn-helix (wHTH) protein
VSAEVSDQKLEASRYRFDDFVLDEVDRQLWHGDTRVDLNARYFDALLLLVRERGRLVEKEQFFDEVWTDVVVSDSALTQCIKEIRKHLGDDASNPRYIQTVPRYGYRFVGTVEVLPAGPPALDPPLPEEPTPPASSAERPRESNWRVGRDAVREGIAGTLGGGLAGVLGGLLYGFGLASADPGGGTLSTLLVLMSINVLVGLTGGLGVSFGMAGAGIAARFWPHRRTALRVAGAALGGLFVGATAKLLGIDAFNLLVGHAPAGITGGPEGAALGAALVLGASLGSAVDGDTHWHGVAGAGLAGTIAGVLIPLTGGHLMGGSLDLLAESFAASRLRLDTFGLFFGELHFGHRTQVILGGVEGCFFGTGVMGAIVAMRRLTQRRPAE